jgi:hypothetical protein
MQIELMCQDIPLVCHRLKFRVIIIPTTTPIPTPNGNRRRVTVIIIVKAIAEELFTIRTAVVVATQVIPTCLLVDITILLSIISSNSHPRLNKEFTFPQPKAIIMLPSIIHKIYIINKATPNFSTKTLCPQLLPTTSIQPQGDCL